MKITPKIKAQFRSITKNTLTDKGFIIIEFRAIPFEGNRSKCEMKFNIFGGTHFGNTVNLKEFLEKLQVGQNILIDAHVEPNEYQGNPYVKFMVDNIELMPVQQEQFNANNNVNTAQNNQTATALIFDDCPF